MSQIEEMEGLKLLQELVKDLESLKYGDSNRAELLYQRTKMYAKKFFGLQYGADLAGLRFRVQFSMVEDLESVWQPNYSKLLAIAKTMLEQYAISGATQPEPQVKYVTVEDTKKVELLSAQVAT